MTARQIYCIVSIRSYNPFRTILSYLMNDIEEPSEGTNQLRTPSWVLCVPLKFRGTHPLLVSALCPTSHRWNQHWYAHLNVKSTLREQIKKSDCLWWSCSSAWWASSRAGRLLEPTRNNSSLPHTDVDELISDGLRTKTSSSVLFWVIAAQLQIEVNVLQH